MVSKVIITILLLGVIALGCVYLYNESAKEVTDGPEYVYCPTESTFTNMWNSWSFDYINENPYNRVDEQMQDWNTLMQLNGCGEEWLDPLTDLIEQQNNVGTPVHWYHEAN